MALDVPKTLSPSKVSTFKDCALRFRLSAIDRLAGGAVGGRHQGHDGPPGAPAPDGPPAGRAHRRRRAGRPAARPGRDGRRSRAHRPGAGRRAGGGVPRLGRGAGAQLLPAGGPHPGPGQRPRADARHGRDRRGQGPGCRRPAEHHPHNLHLRGIIDRLDIDDDGEITVIDYKSGRAPSERFEQGRLSGVHFYAYLCERFLGKTPAKVQLLYLADPGDHHRHAERPVDPRPRPAGRGDLVDGGAGLREGELPRRTRASSARAARTTPTARPRAVARRPARRPPASPSPSSCGPGPPRAAMASRWPPRRPSRRCSRPSGPEPTRPGPSLSLHGPARARSASSRRSPSTTIRTPHSPNRSPTPPPRPVHDVIVRFDDAVDDWWDAHLRGHPTVDRLYYVASQLGDHSLIWFLVGAAQGLRSDRDAKAFVRLAVSLGLESLVVNQGIKRLFGGPGR